MPPCDTSLRWSGVWTKSCGPHVRAREPEPVTDITPPANGAGPQEIPMDYHTFLQSKRESVPPSGIEVDPSTLNPKLFDWQRMCVAWALRRGRAALFEDCGLGKTFQQLEWSAALFNSNQTHAKRILLLCPIAVAEQTQSESSHFNIQCPVHITASQSEVRDGVSITNYEKLHKFDSSQFQAVILDESSILKSFTGAVKRQLCEAFARTPYRLACTATPAPNDHMELGTHAEFLGIMQRDVMLAKWFTHDGGDTSKWRLKRHGAADFWRWVASWAVSISKPSDIGYSDDGYVLPPLNIVEHVVESGAVAGSLFGGVRNVNATNVHDEKRASIEAKAQQIADIVNAHFDPVVIWVDTNYEADAIRQLIPGCVEVRGSDSDTSKAERLQGFVAGRFRVLITKADIAGFGSNWQHCHETHCMANFSFERWYQLIRRFWRFGQSKPVTCHLWSSEAEQNVVATLKRKQADYQEMVGEMCRAMAAGMREELHGAVPLRKYEPTQRLALPGWLAGSRART